MIAHRPDWTISRQRVWGVPIVAFYCEGCGTILLEEPVVAHVAARMEAGEGADEWYLRAAADLLPPGTACAQCGGRAFRKETDILDVWFDSGCSHAAVLETHPELRWPADMYLEGSDQHRGWFHSSLLEAVGTRGRPPYRAVLTHGFVVDGDGRKMSKSIGNTVAPDDVIAKHGAEVLRLWAAGEDYTADIRLSDEILGQLAEAYRRVRNTCRFLLGNLADFDPSRDAVPDAALSGLDRWAMLRLHRTIERVRKAYESYEFHLAFQSLHNFCAVDLSALYLDVLKDRLYTSAAERPGAPRGPDGLLPDPRRARPAHGAGPHLHGRGGLGSLPRGRQGAERPPHRLSCRRPDVARRGRWSRPGRSCSAFAARRRRPSSRRARRS